MISVERFFAGTSTKRRELICIKGRNRGVLTLTRAEMTALRKALAVPEQSCLELGIESNAELIQQSDR